MRSLYLAIIAITIPLVSIGQQSARELAFESASVKPSPPGGTHVGLQTFPGGRITVSRYTLEMLIQEAFDVQSFQVAGGKSWVRDDRFDIEAKPPASSKSHSLNPTSRKAPLTGEQRMMLRALLLDRFQLKVRRGTQQGSIYLLKRGNEILKLTDPKIKGDASWVGSPNGGSLTGDGLAGANVSMAILAARLSESLERLVVDQTGISGFFDFTFGLQSEDQNPDIPSTIITALHGIGLKLEASKGPVDTIFIDYADKPSSN